MEDQEGKRCAFLVIHPLLVWHPRLVCETDNLLRSHRSTLSIQASLRCNMIRAWGSDTQLHDADTHSQTLAGYDEDSTLTIDYLLSLETCNGRIGATGMCLGGHLAYRCALDPRVSAAVTYFATDLHSATLGLGQKDDSLARAGEIKAELALIHGTLDNHVPPGGRDLIRKTLRDKGVVFSFYEVAWAQRKFYVRGPFW